MQGIKTATQRGFAFYDFCDTIKTMTDEQKIAAVKNIVTRLHDPQTGFNGLRHSVMSRLSPSEKEQLKNIKQANLYINNIILEKINQFEVSEQYNKDDFENAVLSEIRTVLQDVKAYSAKHKLDNLDNMKFALDGKTINKYRFYASCGNAAIAFAYENSTMDNGIPESDIMFLNSTRWDHLIDGLSGHTVPYIKLSDGKCYVFDPQINPRNNSELGFIVSDIKIGDTIYHLLPGMRGVPYMVTYVQTPDEYRRKCSDFNYFLSNVSINISNFGKKFLERIAPKIPASERAKYDKYIKAYSLKLASQSLNEIAPLHPVRNKGTYEI